MDRRNWAVAAATAAAVTIALVYGGAPTVALADALKPFKDARSFACDMVPLVEGKPVVGQSAIRLTWAAPGSIRTEILAAGKPQATFVAPHDKPVLMIDHRDRTFIRTDRKPGGQEGAVTRIIDGLAGCSGKDQKPSGTDDVDGVRAPRFDLSVTDVPEAKGGVWRYRLWIHPETKRPLRVEFTPQAGQEPAAKGVSTIRLDRFEWDVKTDGVFDVTPPAGYKSAVLTPEEAEGLSVRRIVAALEAYRSAVGGYPKAEPFDATTATTALERESKMKPSAEVVQGLVMIGVLQSISKDAVYRGKTVGPDDKIKVLFRYKLDDGRYRLIFGDLRSEVVSAEKLTELEGK